VKLSKLKLAVIIVIALFLGALIAPRQTNQKKEIIKEVPKETIREVIKEVPKEVCSNEATWKELKAIDDKALMVAAESFDLMSRVFDAQSKLDFDKIKLYNSQLEAKAKALQSIADERWRVLEKLGY